MKSSKAAEFPSSDAMTVTVASSEAGSTISADGGTSTGVMGVAVPECPNRPPKSDGLSWETLAAEAQSRNS
jgi:hypothetical protein